MTYGWPLPWDREVVRVARSPGIFDRNSVHAARVRNLTEGVPDAGGECFGEAADGRTPDAVGPSPEAAHRGGHRRISQGAFLRTGNRRGVQSRDSTGDTVLDVGANIGDHSAFLAARLVLPEGCVVGFEPAADNLERFAANLALNI